MTVKKAVTCYKVDLVVASLPSFRSVQLSVQKFRAAGEECAITQWALIHSFIHSFITIYFPNGV